MRYRLIGFEDKPKFREDETEPYNAFIKDSDLAKINRGLLTEDDCDKALAYYRRQYPTRTFDAESA